MYNTFGMEVVAEAFTEIHLVTEVLELSRFIKQFSAFNILGRKQCFTDEECRRTYSHQFT